MQMLWAELGLVWAMKLHKDALIRNDAKLTAEGGVSPSSPDRQLRMGFGAKHNSSARFLR